MNTNTNTNITPPIAIGRHFGGGFFAGRIKVGDQEFNLIAAPKAEGQCSAKWNGKYSDIAGAKSFNDGLANTNAMLEAGSKLAMWARDLRIDGKDDWYLPAQDELELLYRHFKPTAKTNSQYGRSGINLSALPATYPYTPNMPAQTSVDVFKEGGEQAFDDAAYWTSTQHAGSSGYAWCQGFNYGDQSLYYKNNELFARAVRRSVI